MLEGEVVRAPRQALLPRWFLCTGRTETMGSTGKGTKWGARQPRFQSLLHTVVLSSSNFSSLYCFICFRFKFVMLQLPEAYQGLRFWNSAILSTWLLRWSEWEQRLRKAGELRCRIVKLSDPAHPGQNVKCFILNFKAWSTMVSCFSLRYNFEQGLCPGNWVAL